MVYFLSRSLALFKYYLLALSLSTFFFFNFFLTFSSLLKKSGELSLKIFTIATLGDLYTGIVAVSIEFNIEYQQAFGYMMEVEAILLESFFFQ